MESRARELITIADREFSKRANLDAYWNTLAAHFYPERADFILGRPMGDWADTGMMTSVPILARRELGNNVATILRPAGAPWFKAKLQDEELSEKHNVRKFLEFISETQRRAMYDPHAQFTRATKEADHDWATFGNGVLSIEVNMNKVALLYRCWHLRDCAWCEDDSGDVDCMYRKYTQTARQTISRFKGNAHPNMQKFAQDDPHRSFRFYHIVVPVDMYKTDGPVYSKRTKCVSLYVDIENEHLMLEEQLMWFPYVVPRWATVSGSQYGFSPACGLGFAEARTLQSVVRVLLEASEKQVDPPMLAVSEAIRSDIDIRASGVTWLDSEYDERTGEALRPLAQKLDIPVGIDMMERIEKTLSDAMFINKLNLPAEMHEMTAYETRKRIEEMVRATMPLFQPAEENYSAPLCEVSFDILRKLGTFGNPAQWPREVLGQDLKFQFKSPITDLNDEAGAQGFVQGMQLLEQALTVKPTVIAAVDFSEAVPEALRGLGWDEDWLTDDGSIALADQAAAKAQQAQQGLATLAQGAPAVQAAANATKAFHEAGVT